MKENEPKTSTNGTLKSLDDFNKERRDLWWGRAQVTSRPNGVACPKCGSELFDTNPSTQLMSFPPKLEIHCEKCNYKGLRVV